MVARYGILAALIAACLVPRVLLASKIVGVCPDGALYLGLAEALERGNLQGGLQGMHLNLYPLLLLGLHRLGLDWDWTGVCWGVFVSSLVVLPLYGWVRRQFDDRVALVACLLYAAHGTFITWSPETLRDSTFWFLFALSIYLLWRAVTEIHRGWFAAAGIGVSLALLTRIEAAFLLIPLVLWSFWRWLAIGGGGKTPAAGFLASCRHLGDGLVRGTRGRLVQGVLICLLVFPALVVGVNFTWLRHHASWEFARVQPLLLVKLWLSTSLAGGPNDVVPVAMSLGSTVWIFVPVLVKGLTPPFALLMLGGLWGWRRVWGRRDHQPLFYASVMLLAAIWIHLRIAQTSCPRYVLPLVLMASPFAALGVLAMTWRTVSLIERFSWFSRLRWAAILPVAAVVACGLGDALGDDYTERSGDVCLGRWLRGKLGPSPVLLGPEGVKRVIGYYAQAQFLEYPPRADDASILAMVRDIAPGAVLLAHSRCVPCPGSDALGKRLEAQGFRRLDNELPPDACREVLVLVRNRPPGPPNRHEAGGRSGVAQRRKDAFHPR